MVPASISLILADDDSDDCLLFSEAVNSIASDVKLTIVNDGEELMQWLDKVDGNLPQVLFLDLNMPRKSGYECLSLIKGNNKLAKLKIIIYSTSLDLAMMDSFYNQGASYYLQKPAEFPKLKSAISKVLDLITDTNNLIVPRDKFIISV